ncbi:hypothetical protein [Larkinella soli]|uniref:hypothetical protein n=1 Tax=Larkinella soli TaxID=1770527 RepID=UPI000FFBD5F4|nr:hypothetical protein [Larkinella soli]
MPTPAGYNLRFWTRYRERSLPGTTDLGRRKRIHIYLKGYEGNPDELERDEDYITGGGDPYRIETEGSNTDPFEPILGKKATIRLVTRDTFALKDLYTDDDRTFFVTVEAEETADNWVNLFSGWITPFDASEPYASAPYPVSFTAKCGLQTLKNIDYPGASRVWPSISTVIECLSRLDYEYPFAFSLKLAEQNQLVSGDYPTEPFNTLFTTKHNDLRFQDANGVWQSCYDVLRGILLSFGARIVQENGAFRIYRVGLYADTDAGNPAIEWVYYTDPADWVTPELIVEEVGKPVYRSYDLKPITGAMLSIEPQYHKVVVNLEYGREKNFLSNTGYENMASGFPVGYTKLGGIVASRVGAGTVEDPYRLRIEGTSDAGAQKSDPQAVQLPVVTITDGYSGTDEWTLSGEYININSRGLKLRIVAYNPEGPTTYILQPDGSWKDNNDRGKSLYFFDTNEYQAGVGITKARPTKGKRFSVTMQPVPAGQQYQLIIYAYRPINLQGQTGSPTPAIELKNFSLSRVDKSREAMRSEKWSAELEGIEGPRRKTDEVIVPLGDQQGARFDYITVPLSGVPQHHTAYRLNYASLLRIDGQTGTSGWVSDPDPFDNPAPLVKILARDRLRLLGKPRQCYDGELFCQTDLRAYDVLLFPELGGLRMLILTLEYTDRYRIAKVRAVEIPAEVGSMVYTSEWEDSSGNRVPILDTGDGSTISPNTGTINGNDASWKVQLLLKEMATGLVKLEVEGDDGQGNKPLPRLDPERLILRVRDAGRDQLVESVTKVLVGMKVR